MVLAKAKWSQADATLIPLNCIVIQTFYFSWITEKKYQRSNDSEVLALMLFQHQGTGPFPVRALYTLNVKISVI